AVGRLVRQPAAEDADDERSHADAGAGDQQHRRRDQRDARGAELPQRAHDGEHGRRDPGAAHPVTATWRGAPLAVSLVAAACSSPPAGGGGDLAAFGAPDLAIVDGSPVDRAAAPDLAVADAPPADALAGPDLDAACSAAYAGCAAFTRDPGPDTLVTFHDYEYVPKCVSITLGNTITFQGDFAVHPLRPACGPALLFTNDVGP